MRNFSTQRNSRFYAQETFLALISVRGRVDPMPIVWPEVLTQRKIQITSWRIEPATFLIMTLCPKQLVYLSINCKIGKEITYSCVTEIGIAVITVPLRASVLRSIPAGHNFIFIYLRSILILSSFLRMLPPSGVLCCRYSGKSFYMFF